ncbi:hypothetical protein lerEdw1_005909 [Lerista edwardsae]|nr:hypothetical protein lerEdw1_005909 [Lerista edwardsae]
MAFNAIGLVVLVVFYLITLATGIWASQKSKKEKSKKPTEIAMVGGRNMNFSIGLFTATATWVGGGYINGTAEIVYLPSRGLVWVQAPAGFALALLIGGLFFVNPMRSKNYVTMMDPIQETYGNVMASLLLIPPLIADVFWFAAILASLGATMKVILDIQSYLAIIFSACTIIFYTLLGGLYSVAYTDVIQLVFMMSSLVRFSFFHFLQILGGIPWQTYFQRVLSASSAKQARLLSCLSGVGCFVMAIPSVLIGAVAASTDWNQTSYGLPTPSERGEAGLILPLVLHHLCPTYISIGGLGAIAAAVMSSGDSALLSASSMFAHNIYRKVLKKKATEKEVLWTMRLSMVAFGTLGAVMAFYSHSVYDIWFLGGELVYVLLFPQLCCVLFIPNTNTYGSAAGFLFGFVLRLLAGEPSLQISPVIHYPGCTLENGAYIQLFPFKFATMLTTLLTIISISYLTAFLFKRNILPCEWDVFQIVKEEHVLISLPQRENTGGCIKNEEL